VIVAVPVPPDADTVIPEVAPMVAVSLVEVAVKVACVPLAMVMVTLAVPEK
jgi:hypothetical protein